MIKTYPRGPRPLAADLPEKLHSLAIRLGYQESEGFERWLDLAERLCIYSFPSSELPTALMAIAFFRKPRKQMIVEFLGSGRERSYLQKTGIYGHCVLNTLHNAQRYWMDRDPASLLPASIDLPAEPNDLFSRLSAEIESVHPAIWAVFAKEWHAAVDPPSVGAELSETDE